MRITVAFISIILFSIPSFSQKPSLEIQNFEHWKSIKAAQISNNGKFVIYELNEQKGDGNLIIYNTETNITDTIPHGYNAKLSPNNDFLVYKIKPSCDTTRKAKLAELKKDKLPKDSIGVYLLSNKSKIKFSKAISYKTADEKSSWLAVLTAYEAKKDTTQTDSTIAKKQVKIQKDAKELLILNPNQDSIYRYQNIEEYSVSKNGNTIAFISQIKDSLNFGSVITFSTLSTATDTVFKDTCEIKKIAIDTNGEQLAFLFSKDTVKNKTFSLQYHHLGNNYSNIIDTLAQGLQNGYCPSAFGSVYFSDDATLLFFGAAKQPVNEPKDSVLDEEKPKVDVWSWTDKHLQTQQLVNLDKEKKRSYLSVFHIKDQKVIQLADTINKSVKLINKKNGMVALTHNDQNYVRASSWNGRWLNDFYLVNLKTGEKELICKAISSAWISPAGNYVVYYNLHDSIYYSWNAKKKTTVALTQHISTPFYYELNDMPTDPYPYGVAGWSDEGKFVYIYDRYDIWQIDPSGKTQAINITNGNGRATKTRFRYLKLDKDLVYLPDTEEVILKGFNENSLHDGYFKTGFNLAQNPQKMLSGPYMYSRSIKKAKNSNTLIYQKQNTQEYPNIFVSDLNFTESKLISDANPQQKNYNWATAELVEWTSFTGENLRGILYKPENFDENKKYPMLVYFYELNSETIHRHYIPSPSRSIINKVFYASQGYLVFVPDITYKTGYPGQSAYNAIVSGVNYLTTKYSYINNEKMALQGQSWGGYQTAFLITQTDMFAAAMAGAPVSNMTSAYGGIRWGSGWSRMFQYEHSQSRIGGSLWDKPLLYIENSPLFHAPKINTPLLMMHNDKDGAVPWYQGIEYFVALRRLNKPVWLLNYNGMKHNIESKFWANRVDLSTRMLQFFDHYLKDKPAPEWMKTGIPATEKGKNLGYD